MLKYQIIISQRATKQPKRTRLKTELPISDVGYWQRRIQEIVDNLGLNEYTTAVIVK